MDCWARRVRGRGSLERVQTQMGLSELVITGEDQESRFGKENCD